jgi:hypothetical protein
MNATSKYPILVEVKAHWNGKIYKGARTIFIASGKDAMIEYMLQYIRDDRKEDYRTKLMAL